MKLYESLAQELTQRIEQGYYQPGEKLPSIRDISREQSVSISTVQEAYRLLEDRQLTEARPKSGYYVLAPKTPPSLPNITRPAQKPLEVSQWELVLNLLKSHEKDGGLALGKGTPNVDAASLKPIWKIMSRFSQRADLNYMTYDSLQGAEELRLEITRLMTNSGCFLHPDDILITTGCQEALTCCLRAITQPGDIIAIESPSFYGSMQAVQAMGLKAMEIPTHPTTGISLEALELALEQWPIKAVQLTPICNNPLGYTMPDENKQRLVEMASQYDFDIIEDDIYGDLSYTSPRPKTIKSFDEEGRVLFCSSFSKTLSPVFRTGWCAPGRHFKQVEHLKYVSTACGSVLQPRAVAEFIAQGHYDKHIRKMRAFYLRNRDQLIHCIQQHFPKGTKMTYPQGGFLLWVELPNKIDAVKLNEAISEKNISIAPGILFTASRKYRHCLRINYAYEVERQIGRAIEVIGEAARGLVKE